MKKIILILVWTALLFLGLTIVTASIEAPSDGNNSFGFPFTFYRVYGGKRTYYHPDDFSILTLLLDVLCAGIIFFAGKSIFASLKAKIRKKNNES